MTKEARTLNRYSISFKKQLIGELESGTPIYELQRRYDIRGADTIQRWIRQYGKNHLLNKIVRIETMNEKDRLKKLEEENKALKQALADSIIANRCLETLVEEANKEYNTDLKKNFGSGVSGIRAKI
jgi:transposase-like protein